MKKYFVLILISVILFLSGKAQTPQEEREIEEYIKILEETSQFGLFSKENDKEIFSGQFLNDSIFETGLQEVNFDFVKSMIEEISSDLYPFLNANEKLAFDSLEYKIDSDIDLYFPDMPIKVNKKEKTLTFKPRWFLEFFNFLASIQIERIPEFERVNFVTAYHTFKLTGQNIGLAYQHAGLFPSQEIELKSYSKINSLSLIYYLNVQFIYLHELSHILYPNFSEIQADDFAIEKMISIWLIPKKDFWSYELAAKVSGIPSVVINGMEEKGKIHGVLCLIISQTLDFITMEMSLSPIDYLESYEELLSRSKNIHQKAYSLMDCDNNLSEDYCSYINSYLESQNQTFEYLTSMSNRIIEIESKLENISLDDDMLKLRKLFKEINPSNPAAICFFYGNYLLAKQYFDLSDDYTSEAIRVFRLGSTYIMGPAIPGEKCQLMLAKIYERKIKDKEKAEYHYSKAQILSRVFPLSFYVFSKDNLKELFNENEAKDSKK